MSSKSGYRGYIGSRKIRGISTPQSIQNLVIRDYAKRRNLNFLLSGTEYAMDSCYMMLESILSDLDNLEGLILYSLFMLPENPVRRRDIYQRILASNSSLHTALEGIVLAREKDIALLEDLLAIEAVATKWEPV